MRSVILAVSWLLVGAMALPAHSTPIDLLPFGSFSTTVTPISSGRGGQQSSTSSVLGGFREFRIEGVQNSGAELRAFNPGFRVRSGSLSSTSGYYILDGSQFNGGAAVLNPDVDGLGTDGNGEDLLSLSDGGDRFQLNVSSITGIFDVGVSVWSDGGLNNFELVKSDIDATGSLEYLFSDFASIDFNDVSAMVFAVSAQTADSEILISEFLVPSRAVPTPPPIALALAGLVAFAWQQRAWRMQG